MKKLNVLIIVAFFGILNIGNAQQELGLKECIRIAFEKNLDIKGQYYNLSNSEIDLKQAKQSRLPNLNANSSINFNLGKSIDPTSNSFADNTFISNNYGLSSNVTIYNFNRINNLLKQAKLSQSSSKIDLEQLKMDIALSVTNAYVNTLFAKENLKNSQLQLENAQNQLSQMEKLINVGSRPENDNLDLIASVAIQEQNSINFQNQYDLAKLNLKQLLRFEFNQDLSLQLDERITLNANAETMTIENLINAVIDRYPALKSAKLNSKIAAIQVDVAKSALYPSLGAGVSLGSNYSNQGRVFSSFNTVLNELPVQINGQNALLGTYNQIPIYKDQAYGDQLKDNISYGLGVSLNIPIYNNFRNKASVEKAKIYQLQTENNYEKLKDQIILNLQQVLADARASKKELTASEKSMSSLQSAYENAEKKSLHGSISTFEFLQSKNQLDSAILKHTIAKYNYMFKVKLLDYYLGEEYY